MRICASYGNQIISKPRVVSALGGTTGQASKESKAPFGVNLKTFLVDPIYLLYFDYVRFKRTTRIGADGLFCAYLRTNLL